MKCFRIIFLALAAFSCLAFTIATPFVGSLTNSALKGRIIVGLPSGATITRTGFAVDGDSPPVNYTFSTSACSIGSGAGDNGLQVKPTAGTGCWIANLPSPADVRVWGCKGDNTKNNAACLTAAINSGVKHIQIPSKGIFRVGSALASTPSVSISGSYRSVGIYNNSCTNGLRFTTANIAAITLNGAGSSLTGVCIDYTVVNTSGSGVVSPGGANASRISNNQINGACVGIDITGTGVTQNVGSFVEQNTIITSNNADCPGIRLGVSSIGGNLVDLKLSANQVYCGNDQSIALLVLDSGGLQSTANLMGYRCNTGTTIFSRRQSASFVLIVRRHGPR